MAKNLLFDSHPILAVGFELVPQKTVDSKCLIRTFTWLVQRCDIQSAVYIVPERFEKGIKRLEHVIPRDSPAFV
jgi:hypothetical protein